MIDITQRVSEIVRQSLPTNGLCVVYVPHTTCGLTINENADSDVVRDILFALDRAVPDSGFHHGEGNSAAHVKSSMMGFSLTIPVENKRMLLGTWQGVYLCEFDGARMRNVLVKCIEG